MFNAHCSSKKNPKLAHTQTQNSHWKVSSLQLSPQFFCFCFLDASALHICHILSWIVLLNYGQDTSVSSLKKKSSFFFFYINGQNPLNLLLLGILSCLCVVYVAAASLCDVILMSC